MSKIVGYIVVSDSKEWPHVPLMLGDDRVLWIGTGDTTLFKTRRQAHAAIARTDAYAKSEKLPWPKGHRIYAVREIAS